MAAALRAGLQKFQKELQGAKQELVEEKKAIEKSQKEQKMDLRAIAQCAEKKINELAKQLEKKEAAFADMKSTMKGEVIESKKTVESQRAQVQQLRKRIDGALRHLGQMCFEMAEQKSKSLREEKMQKEKEAKLKKLQEQLDEHRAFYREMGQKGGSCGWSSFGRTGENGEEEEEENIEDPDAPLDPQQDTAPKK